MVLIKKILRITVWLLGGIFVFAVGSNLWIILSTQNQIHTIDEITGLTKTGLILGTSYNSKEGETNPFFSSRIQTGVELYEHNIVSEFILSGSSTEYYNEPRYMAKDMILKGIPNEVLINDTLGVRTLASIIRCKEVYKKDKIVIVTQKFHAYRALFISNFYGIDAIAVATQDVESPGKVGVVLREVFARPLAVIDLYFLNSKP